MHNTYVALTVHVIFATKWKEPILTAEALDQLPGYLGGVLVGYGALCLAANGSKDHIHLVVQLQPRIAIDEVIRHAKECSTKWLRTKFAEMRRFAWQDGYAAYSVSSSQVREVLAYVDSQREHHITKDFEKEYLEFLNAAGMEYDSRYLFDPVPRQPTWSPETGKGALASDEDESNWSSATPGSAARR